MDLIGHDMSRKTPTPLRIAYRRVLWTIEDHAHEKQPPPLGPP